MPMGLPVIKLHLWHTCSRISILSTIVDNHASVTSLGTVAEGQQFPATNENNQLIGFRRPRIARRMVTCQLAYLSVYLLFLENLI